MISLLSLTLLHIGPNILASSVIPIFQKRIKIEGALIETKHYLLVSFP